MLRVYNSPKPLEENVYWCAMAHFDGKLVVADEVGKELIALQGL